MDCRSFRRFRAAATGCSRKPISGVTGRNENPAITCFFASAMAGVPLAAAARLVVRLASGQFPEIEARWRSHAPFDHSDTVAPSILFALAFPSLANLVVNKGDMAAKAARESGGLVEWTIRDALHRRMPIEIATRTSKS